MRRLSLLLTFGLGGPALTSDHGEAPLSSADPAADIADFYAWHTGDGTLVAIVTFAAGAGGALYDADVLYGIHIDNDGDSVADVDIWARFGQDADGAWGLQVTDLPGSTGVMTGPVDTQITDGLVSVWVGERDDPFFFDITGFADTLATGNISFDASRDGFAGGNVTALVVEMSTAAATGSAHQVQMWTTTGRK